MKPFFSIITVCYNSASVLKQTIESVLSQDMQDYELIIVDGGSKDNTNEIVHNYLEAFNGRCKYISEADNGVYDAMNKGIMMSSGKWLHFLNSEDYFCDSKVLSNTMKKVSDQYVIAYGLTASKQSGEDLSSYDYGNITDDKNFFLKNMICHQAIFFNFKVFKMYGLYNTKYKIIADYEFVSRVFNDNSSNFMELHFPIAVFHKGLSNNFKILIREKIDIVRSRYSSYLPLFVMLYYSHLNLFLDKFVVLVKRLFPNKFFFFIRSIYRIIRYRKLK